MMLKETIRLIVKTQRPELLERNTGIPRELLKDIDTDIPMALVISGVRRCGKSTLLKQCLKKIKNPYYFSFEDPRAASFEVDDFTKLDEVFQEEYGSSGYYLFDEIQNAPQWERFIRSMLDKKRHFLITGSNASLLSKELGTKLTGRHLRHELFPFSFAEFLQYTSQKASISSFESYFQQGGFPEYLRFGRAEILQELFNDIIVRDIVVRHKIRSVNIIKEIALYLLTNVGKEFSYNALKKIFNLGSTNSAIAFVSYLEESYLLFTISRFDYSLKKRLVSPKKIYCIDNGFSAVNSASFSADKGRMLENIVFLNLRKKYKEIFYFREKHECDFVVKDKEKITQVIQVSYAVTDDNKERETNGLLEALDKFNLKEGVILTYNQEDEIRVSHAKITLKPVWKWLLE